MATATQTPPRREDAHLLTASLGLADRLLEAASAVLTGAPGLGEIDLPPVVGGDEEQAQLRAASPLYLCSDLEAARLLPAAEMLAGLFAQGGLMADPGPAAPLLERLWQERHQRWSAQERQALFARVFGTMEGPLPATPDGRNTDFPRLMSQFVEALAKLGADPYTATIPESQESVRITAEELAQNLLPRTQGIALFAAQELVRAVREALAIFEQPSVQHSVGQATVWGAVRAVCHRYFSADPDVTSYLTRGKSGAILLAWLAETASRLENVGGGLAGAADPVVAAAAAWVSANDSLQNSEVNASPGSG